MLRLLLLRFWPVLIPLLLYILWLALRRRRARKNEEDIPGWLDGPWMWAVAASFILLILGFLILGIWGEGADIGQYTPARVENGRIIDGSIE